MRVTIITLSIFALLIGGYIFWWNSIADTAVSQFEAWKKDRLSDGITITHQPVVTSGFPYRVKLDLEDVKITRDQSETQFGFETTVPTFWVLAQPWKPAHIIFGTLGTSSHAWTDGTATRSISVKPEAALGSATFTSSGKFKTLAIDITKSQIQSSSYGQATVDRLQLHSRMATAPKKTEGSDAPASGTQTPMWQIAVTADDVVFENGNATPLGGTITKANISATVDGRPKDFKTKTSIERWRDQGGSVEILDMNLIWGESQISGNGAVALDENNQPLGAFSTKITGFNDLLALLEKSQKLDKQSLKTAAMALNLISKEDENARRYLDLPMSLQNGGLYIGPFKLMNTVPLF